jgi:hypothetical protein
LVVSPQTSILERRGTRFTRSTYWLVDGATLWSSVDMVY